MTNFLVCTQPQGDGTPPRMQQIHCPLSPDLHSNMVIVQGVAVSVGSKDGAG
jgi:hypothetical protein